MSLNFNSCLEETLRRFPGHWRLDEDSNNYKLLKIICTRFELLNDAMDYIYKMWHIDTAEGVHLDVIGKDLGLPRDGMSDEKYRKMLKVKEYLDLSNGTIEEIDTILGAFMEGDYVGAIDAWQTEVEEPAAIILRVSKNASELPFEIANLSKSGGVKIYYSAIFDAFAVVLLHWFYEHKVYYPVTNIKHTGHKKGAGYHAVMIIRFVEYEHKVFYDHAGRDVLQSDQQALGDWAVAALSDGSYTSVVPFAPTGVGRLGVVL